MILSQQLMDYSSVFVDWKSLICLLLLFTLLHDLVLDLVHLGLHLGRHTWHAASLSLQYARALHQKANRQRKQRTWRIVLNAHRSAAMCHRVMMTTLTL